MTSAPNDSLTIIAVPDALAKDVLLDVVRSDPLCAETPARFLTAPITAHFIAKVYLHHNVRRGDLPATGTSSPWASETEEAPGQKQDD